MEGEKLTPGLSDDVDTKMIGEAEVGYQMPSCFP